MRKKKPDCIIPKFYKFYYDVNILRESKKGRRKVGEVRYVDKFWNWDVMFTSSMFGRFIDFWG